MRIGVTLGDPAGIGPELVAQLPAGGEAPIVYGDRSALERAAALVGGTVPPGLVEVTKLADVRPGSPSARTGAAQIAYLEAAMEDARAQKIDALVTAPIHKASCIAAGFSFPGHTEFLQARLGAPHVTMMLAGPRLRVTLATVHLALADVARSLDVVSLTKTIVQTARALHCDFAIAAPHVAVAALNPHAGEAGHFGNEEARLITPAIERARAELPCAFVVSGPHVPDAIFRSAVRDGAGRAGGPDAVVAMYHDQGLIPIKLVDFENAVNVTLGLSIVRTSPDHGVAYDLAGTGRCRPTSFLAAYALAGELRARRRDFSRSP